MADAPTFMIEDATIIYRNFKGAESQFNRAGERNFCAIIDPDLVDQFVADGWNIKTTNPREEGDEGVPYLQIKVNYDNRPPRVVMITNDGNTRTPLDSSTVETLDYADIQKVDLVARAYDWNVGGKSGRTAYLKTMFVWIEEDELEKKYGVGGPVVEEPV